MVNANRKPTHPRFKDLAGKQFGEWTVLSYSGGGRWACRCGCGDTHNVVGGLLAYGRTLRCRKCWKALPRKRTPTADRFKRNVGPLRTDGCMYWMGGGERYGRLGIGGSTFKGAHCVAYELANGPIPEGMIVRHTCDVPKCVNPAHLILGTNADNSKDMVDRNRSARGEKNCKARLTAEDVKHIREEFAGGAMQVDLAVKYGVRQTNISAIVLRQTWRHV